uniref:host specificity factor TipJ family phage tail protein n=1 Tax=Methylibium sp. TaxID=2067992 RepID=UPI003340AEDE
GGAFEIQANSKSAVRRSVRFRVTRGQYDVQVRRLTIDDQSDNVGDNQSVTSEQSFWTAMRSHQNEPPVTRTGIARIAVRAQATDQLSGVIEQLNCTVTSVLPVWNGATWVEQATRNPAWAFADVLRGSANARPVPDSRIDLDALLAWATWCDANGFTFDGVFDRRQSVYECLQEIAATACASPTVTDGKFSVVVDNTRDTVIQHFTPRNLRSFSSTKVFAVRPHAVKVIFYPESSGHQAEELFVYDDGYTAANSTLFETLELPYTTSAQAAWKRGRRAMFAARLRSEVYEGEADIEHLVCNRGDLVRVRHDVMLWGLGEARVASLVTSGADTAGIIVDAPLTMAGGTSYGIRVRQASTSAEYTLTTVAGDQTQLDFATPVATASGPAVGDLVQFGELGAESVELLVRSIEPGADMSARISFVDYAPAIQTSDSGSIPDFDPQITTPPAINRPRPPKPVILSIDSDEDALIRSSDGTLISRILLSVTVIQSQGLVPAEVIQTRYRPADTNQDFAFLPALPAQAGEISVMPVEDGQTYVVQLRSVSQAGATSDWTEITHTVVGKTTPPPALERLYRQGNLVIGPYASPPLDLAGFLFRAHYGTDTTWSTARALHAGVLSVPSIDISALSGTQTVLCKPVDTSGIEALSAVSVTLGLGDLIVANVIETQAEGPAWAGVLSGGTDTGTDLEASLLSSPPAFDDLLGPAFSPGSDPAFSGSVYSEMQYTARYTPDALYLGDGLL